MKHLVRSLACAGLATASIGAWATPCDNALIQYSIDISSNNPVNAAQVIANHPECFGGSSTTSTTQINGTQFRQIAAITGALNGRFVAPGPNQLASTQIVGGSAGAEPGKLNVWANVTTSDTRQTYANLSASTTYNNSDVLNTVVGADYRLSPAMVAGLSLAIDRTDGSGTDSSPTATVNINIADGFTVAPYVGMQLNKEWAVDASVGFGKAEMSMGGTANLDIDRWFAAGNLTYNRWMGQWQFGGKASYLHGEEKYSDIKNSGASITGSGAKNKIDQIQVGAQAGYWVGGGWMPYGALKYSSDVNRSTTQFGAPANPIGRNAVVWTAGLNYYSVARGITAGLSYSVESGRTNQKNEVLQANVNLRF